MLPLFSIAILLPVLLGLSPMAFGQDGVPAPPPLVSAIQKGDLEKFRNLVSSETLKKPDGGGEAENISGINVSDVLQMVTLGGNEEMLAHLFSLGAPADLSEVCYFAISIPDGESFLESLIENYPGIKNGQAGTEFLCEMISRFELNGADEPNPLVVQLVEAGVPIEWEPYSALVSAVEFRDNVLIKYLLGKGADRRLKADWHLKETSAMKSVWKKEFNAEILAAVTSSFDSLELMTGLKGFAKTEAEKFRKKYPPQPESPLLGTYEVLVSNNKSVNVHPYFRLLPDSTALFPTGGVSAAAVWTVEGDWVTFHPMIPPGRIIEKLSTRLKKTKDPGVLKVVTLHGKWTEGVKAHLISEGSGGKFEVPADSAAIGTWKGQIKAEGAPPMSLTIELTADGGGKMSVTPDSGDANVMDLAWKHVGSQGELKIYQAPGGKIQRNSAKKFKLSSDSNKMSCEDQDVPELSRVE